MGRKAIDLTGCKFGRLTVIEYAGIVQREAHWKCRCECGNICIKNGSLLRRGQTRSCGCYQRTWPITHGMSRARLYEIWNGMHQRCENPKSPAYNNYGGRGIKVCEEWRTFEPFADWAIENGYSEKLSVDRIDVNGNYCSENCRFATKKEQANNKRNNRYIEYNGEVHTISEWSDIVGIKYTTLLERIIKSGWSAEKALTTPVR